MASTTLWKAPQKEGCEVSDLDSAAPRTTGATIELGAGAYSPQLYLSCSLWLDKSLSSIVKAVSGILVAA